MNVQRVYRPASLKQQDRLPISTYEEALRHLVFVRIDETQSDETYFALVKLVGDIFWRSDKRVLRDVRVTSRDLGADQCL